MFSTSAYPQYTCNDDIFSNVYDFVARHMGQAHFDASHDFEHVKRVLANARDLLVVESARPGAPIYNQAIVDLAALLHDVDDHKYVQTGAGEFAPITPKTVLLDLGVDSALAEAVGNVCENVSYSHEMKNHEKVQAALKAHPELAVVQDADRLDAIGAVGIARVFAFTGARSATGPGRSLEGTLEHFREKLERLQALMKTEEGRRLAKQRTARLKEFKDWFRDEISTKVEYDVKRA